MTGTTTKKLTKNEFVIQGLFKEALTTESIFFISELALSLRLADISEEKIREGSNKKSLIFKPIVSPIEPLEIKPEVGKPYTVQAGLYQAQIQCTLSCIKINDDGAITFQMPEEVKLLNFRKALRNNVSQELVVPSPILVETAGSHAEAVFILEDTSQDGVGGMLYAPIGFPVGLNSSVSGDLYAKQGELHINGRIVRASAQTSTRDGYEAYHVGIVQKTQPQSPHLADRREQNRHKIVDQIEIAPLLHENYRLKVNLTDISVSGFSAKPNPDDDLLVFPIGSIFRHIDTETKICLVAIDGETLRFRITVRSEKESISWLRKMTPSILREARCSTKDVRDLHKIFLQSGAISSAYLKRHTQFESKISAQQFLHDAATPYIHRWFVKGENNENAAYISAIRISDSCWIIGDIAKISDSTVSANTYVKAFFNSFAEMCISSKPTPAVGVMWIKNHPFWAGWEQEIDRDKGSLLTKVKIGYIRLSEASDLDAGQASFKKIESSNFETVSHVSDLLKSGNIDKFAETILDFSLTNFGSPRLSIETGEEGFVRNYYFEETSRTLLVLTRYPNRTSMNRVADSAYLLIPDNTKIESEKFDELLDGVRKLAVESGILLPSIRIVSSLELPNRNVSNWLDCVVVHPRVLKRFGEKNES